MPVDASYNLSTQSVSPGLLQSEALGGQNNTNTNTLSERIESVTNTVINIVNSRIASNASGGGAGAFFSNTLKFIRNWGPNHIIFQTGPQLHNAATGVDYKFTLTAVIAADHAEIYPLHNEIGYAMATGSNSIKAYALGIHQQGINIDWKNRELSYLKQILGRVEIDVPYGNTGMQTTIGFEVGITDKTRGLTNSIKHAVQDFQTSSVQALALIGIDFVANKDLIEIITSSLLGTFALPEVLTRLNGVDNDKESVLFIGLSIGYVDYNGTLLKDLGIFSDAQHRGVNIQANIYTRHGQIITYDFKNKKYTLPHALIKAITLVNGGNKPEFIRTILRTHTEVNHLISEGSIPAVAGRTVSEFWDEVVTEGVIAIDNHILQSHMQEGIITHL